MNNSRIRHSWLVILLPAAQFGLVEPRPTVEKSMRSVGMTFLTRCHDTDSNPEMNALERKKIRNQSGSKKKRVLLPRSPRSDAALFECIRESMFTHEGGGYFYARTR